MSQLHILDTSKPTFDSLFRKYRLLSGFSTLSELADALADEGLIIDISILSRWQTGDRVPQRKQLLSLIRIFNKTGAIATQNQIDQFFESVNEGYLTSREFLSVFSANENLINCNSEKEILNLPIAIDSLRKQGDLKTALQLCNFFSDNLTSFCHYSDIQNKFYMKLMTVRAEIRGDFAFPENNLSQMYDDSQAAIAMSKQTGNRHSFNKNSLNLILYFYLEEKWSESLDLIKKTLFEVGEKPIKTLMIQLALLNSAHLGNKEEFISARMRAEKMIIDISDNDFLYGSLLEAISRSLVIMGDLSEAEKIASKIKDNKARPFLESQLVRLSLMLNKRKAEIGQTIDVHRVNELVQYSQKRHLQVFKRHQHQIKQLVSEICQLQPRVAGAIWN